MAGKKILKFKEIDDLELLDQFYNDVLGICKTVKVYRDNDFAPEKYQFKIIHDGDYRTNGKTLCVDIEDAYDCGLYNEYEKSLKGLVSKKYKGILEYDYLDEAIYFKILSKEPEISKKEIEDKVKRIEYIIESFDENFLNMKDENDFLYEFGLFNKEGRSLNVLGQEILNKKIFNDKVKSNLYHFDHGKSIQQLLRYTASIKFYIYTNIDQKDSLEDTIRTQKVRNESEGETINKIISDYKEYLEEMEESLEIVQTDMERLESYFNLKIDKFSADFLENEHGNDKFGFFVDVKI